MKTTSATTPWRRLATCLLIVAVIVGGGLLFVSASISQEAGPPDYAGEQSAKNRAAGNGGQAQPTGGGRTGSRRPRRQPQVEPAPTRTGNQQVIKQKGSPQQASEELVLRVISLKSGDSMQIVEVLNEVIGDELRDAGGRLAAHNNSNHIVIRAPAATLEAVEKLVEALDKPEAGRQKHLKIPGLSGSKQGGGKYGQNTRYGNGNSQPASGGDDLSVPPVNPGLNQGQNPGRNQYQLAQQRAQAVANQVRSRQLAAQSKGQNGANNSTQLKGLVAQLETLVRETLQLHQRLQREEVQLLRQRLDAVEKKLAQREASMEQMIQRRVEELIEGRTPPTSRTPAKSSRNASPAYRGGQPNVAPPSNRTSKIAGVPNVLLSVDGAPPVVTLTGEPAFRKAPSIFLEASQEVMQEIESLHRELKQAEGRSKLLIEKKVARKMKLYEALHREFRAAERVAQSQLEAAESKLKLAEQEVARRKQLKETGADTQSSVEQGEAALENAKQNYTAMREFRKLFRELKVEEAPWSGGESPAEISEGDPSAPAGDPAAPAKSSRNNPAEADPTAPPTPPAGDPAAPAKTASQ